MGMKAGAVAGAPLQGSSSRADLLLQRSVLHMHIVFLEPNSSESVHPSSAADKKSPLCNIRLSTFWYQIVSDSVSTL